MYERDRVNLAEWQRAVRSATTSGVFRIVVLGASPTAGCGSVDAGGNESHKLCSLPHSWGRRMHDAVVRATRGARLWTLPIETRIYSKNAVTAEYFAHCTSEMVPASANLVLLETGTNLWGLTPAINARVLETTAAAIRRTAPSAVLAFALWPHNEMRKRVLIPRLVRSVAARVNVSAIEVFDGADEPWIEDEAANETYHCRPRCSMYGNRGRDIVHPGPKGHVVLARRVASFVVGSLLAASCTRAGATAAAAPSTADETRASGGASGTDPKGWADQELCFPSAELLPLSRGGAAAAAPGGSWELRDEGGEKGVPKLGLVSSRASRYLPLPTVTYRYLPLPQVPKLGLVSSRAGDALRLELRPEELHRLAARCDNATLRARLGYLLSPAPSQGRLRVECRGACGCARSAGTFADAFPLIETSLERSDLGRVNGVNMTVTATADFLLAYSRSGPQRSPLPCVIGVKHEPTPVPKAPPAPEVGTCTPASPKDLTRPTCRSWCVGGKAGDNCRFCACALCEVCGGTRSQHALDERAAAAAASHLAGAGRLAVPLAPSGRGVMRASWL